MGNAMSLVASVALPLGGGMIIGYSLRNESQGKWYKEQLKKPSWNPPGWVFGPVWTTLYTAIGYAAWRVWQAGGGPLPLGLYLGQLALNFAWSPLFFGKKDLKLATIDITALVGLVAATAYEFSKVDQTAGLLMLPYLAWGAFATALTWNIWLNNSQDGKQVKATAKQAANQVEGAASEATAAAAKPFLAQGGERQHDRVPPEAAAATAARAGAKAD